MGGFEGPASDDEAIAHFRDLDYTLEVMKMNAHPGAPVIYDGSGGTT